MNDQQNQRRNKKPLRKDDKSIKIFSDAGYVCIKTEIYEKMIRALKGNKSIGDRSNDVLKELSE